MGRIGAMHHAVKPLARGMKLCGPAFTVKSPAGDNVTILKAIREARAGDVIVVDCGRILDAGPFGELTCLECKTRGLGGFVTTGSVRDSAEIIASGFPVFSAAVSIVGTVKESPGLINHPICAGDVIVRPGDVLLGDDDGIVVIPLEKAEEALEKSDARLAKEAAVMEKLRAGGSIFDIYGYQAVLDRHGWTEEQER
jgi:4-hydroxy-4-methyl-2-oxoglutarate aldolase